MRIKTWQKKSPLKRECEDTFFCNEDVKMYGVCDGATPLVAFQDENGHNGAYLASNLFANRFKAQKEIISLEKEIIEANEALQKRNGAI